MAVPVEAYSVIVRNSAIERKYPGGLKSYERNSANPTFCADPHLNRIAFMTLDDTYAHLRRLEAYGLTYDPDSSNSDITVVDQDGLIKPCPWLSFMHHQGILLAWLIGTEVGSLHAPAGWTFENAVNNLRHMTATEVEQQLEYVRSDEKVDVYKDKATGKEVFVGRTEKPHSAELEHDSLYEKGVALSKDLISLDGRPQKELSQAEREQLNQAIEYFERVIQINSQNLKAMWIIGKIWQRLNEHKTAFRWFVRAHEMDPSQPDVAREASIAAMEVDQPLEAILFCERAIAARPGDPSLKSNLALALLFSGKPKDAQKVARESLKQAPKDQITARLLKLIDDVVSGKKKCPHNMRELQ